MRKAGVLAIGVLLATAMTAAAAAFSTVRGVVHDAQHRPIPGATVTITARTSEWSAETTTGADGTFEFRPVAIGDYLVTVTLEGFTTAQQPVTVVSSTTPVLHIALDVAGLTQAVTVRGTPEDIHPDSMTPTTLVSRDTIRDTPGADRSNSLQAITAFVPGAYVTHDQLHMRGGHQVTWLVDGVPVPNTNIASNVGPQFDPKDIDFLEVQRGSYDAQYGDRTYGVFNVVPRTGFERDSDAEVVVSAGNYRQTNDQVSVGGHTSRFAYFASANGNHSDLGLETPVTDVVHDAQAGLSGFSSLIFNVNPSNQLRLVTSVRHDRYDIPTAPGETDVNDQERESDAFLNVSWVRTFRGGTLLTVSPFYHFNAANYDGDPADVPVSTTDEHASHYGGAQATVHHDIAWNSIDAGFYGFHQQDHETFSVTFSDGSSPDLFARTTPSGTTATVFAQDKVQPVRWLTLTAGIRQTHFSGAVTENATDPRVGASIQVPRLGWVVRGFYGRFYQEPPLITASGPLVAFVTDQNLTFVPLHGERDTEYQVGLAVPLRGWTVDADHFQTRATNFFDHNPIGNSNVFFPVTIDGALIRGTEVTLRSPRAWSPGEFHLAYSYQRARGHGGLNGGLTDFESEDGDFPLDHDQRHTFSAGFSARLARGYVAAANVAYGSGFPIEDEPTYLPGHTTVDLTLGKTLGKNASVSVTALNIANTRVLIDNSLTFGGTHYNSPREVYGEFRFRFHY